MNFEELVRKAGITKAQLGRTLGIHHSTVYGWQDDPPIYVVKYLELLGSCIPSNQTPYDKAMFGTLSPDSIDAIAEKVSSKVILALGDNRVPDKLKPSDEVIDF